MLIGQKNYHRLDPSQNFCVGLIFSASELGSLYPFILLWSERTHMEVLRILFYESTEKLRNVMKQ